MDEETVIGAGTRNETEYSLSTSKCAVCRKEAALAVFGILFGLVVIAMSVDVFRKLRVPTETVSEVGSDG